MKISVITPTIRPEGLVVLANSLKKQTLKDFEWLVDINISGKPDFNQAMNRMLRRSQGELIVSIQDFIQIPEDGLEQFWVAYKDNPNTFFTAPVGKTLDWQTIEYDWRKDRVDQCNWMEWEIDYGCASYEALQAIGGFDEELDTQWGFDNVNIGLRAEIGGYVFKNLPNNCATAYDHNRKIDHPFLKLRDPDFHNQRLDEFRRGHTVHYI